MEGNFIDKAERTTAYHDGNHVPLPLQHPDEGDEGQPEGEPIELAVIREERVQGEPDGEVQERRRRRRR